MPERGGWNAQQMKQEGGHALDQAIASQAVEDLKALTIEFLRLKAGHRQLSNKLKDKGIGRDMIDSGDADSIVTALLSPAKPLHAMPVEISVRPPDEATAGARPSLKRSLDGTLQMPGVPEMVDASDLEDLGMDSEVSSEDEAGQAALVADAVGRPKEKRHGKGHSKGGGKGRPPRAELEQWAASLTKHSKFRGVSTDRYRGMEFKRVLKDEVTAAGMGTKPGELRPHRTLPTELNRAASVLCNEAGTQATCECHSAGTVKLEPRLQAFLSACVSEGLTRVNIVTGLGSHGGGGTIRQLMPQLLQADANVQSFQLASNFSAVYVDLPNFGCLGGSSFVKRYMLDA